MGNWHPNDWLLTWICIISFEQVIEKTCIKWICNSIVLPKITAISSQAWKPALCLSFGIHLNIFDKHRDLFSRQCFSLSEAIICFHHTKNFISENIYYNQKLFTTLKKLQYHLIIKWIMCLKSTWVLLVIALSSIW